MKRTRLENSCCPIARSLDVIGDWWSLLIVRDALREVRRFSEFQEKPRYRQKHARRAAENAGG